MSGLEAQSGACPAHNVGGYGGPCDWRSVRVVGDVEHAHIETAAPYPSYDTPWVAEVVPGTVRVDVLGEVTVESDALDASAIQCLQAGFRAALRNAGLVRLETGKRYQTVDYCTLDFEEAKRLASIDGCAHVDDAHVDDAREAKLTAGGWEVRRVEVEVNGSLAARQGLQSVAILVSEATILHATGDWAFWSDGRFSTAIGLPVWATQIRSLAPAAVDLISASRGSDSGPPTAIGGYKALADVVACVESTVAVGPPRGHYHRATLERLDLTMRDGSTRTIYRYTMGYCEGYVYELGPTIDSVLPEVM